MPIDDTTREVRYAQGSSGQSPDAGLARQLGELARELQAEPDTAALLARITASAVAEVNGADYAGISRAQGSHVHSEAETDPLITRIDDQQYKLQQGPCLSSLREQVTVRADDLTADTPWPAFAAAISGFGVQSMLSVQLFVDGDNLGALNMYATRPNAFTDDDESTAMLLAVHAALAMKGSDTESNLRVALDSRDVIGQAKGILMERYKIDAVEAFHLLVLASQHTNKKLRHVAEDLAATGELKAT